jgi:hypothetical protein
MIAPPTAGLAHVLVANRRPPRIKSGAGFRRNMRWSSKEFSRIHPISS